MLGDDPPYLSVGTEVSAKYKGAFCEAKIRKVVRSVKCRVTYKQGLGTTTVTDDQIKGTLRVGAAIEAWHGDRKEFVEATITKIQDCSQYTVVFDDGDITTLRRTALCLKSGRHFAESETLDQLPLTHPEHFGNPVIGGRRGRRSRQAQDESSEDEDVSSQGNRDSNSTDGGKEDMETEPEIGRVVCVELGVGDKKKNKKDNWVPGLVVAPTAQATGRIRVRDEYLVRSFKDARYYTVPKKEATEFTKELVNKVESSTLKVAVEKALLFLEKNELPPHWDRDSLFGHNVSSGNSDSDADLDSDSSDDEPREEKDHFVAQLYKFMDDRGTPINNCPMIGSEDIDLYRLFRAVYKLGGYNRVTNQNQWKVITRRLSFTMQNSPSTHNLVKQAYKKFLHSFEDFYRKLGCTMVNHPRGSIRKQRPGRSLIRDKDRNTPVPPQTPAPKSEKEEEDKKVIEDDKKEKKDIKKEPVKEEDSAKMKRKDDFEENISGQESDINIEAEGESSSSEKSQKVTPQLSSVPTKTKSKTKEDTKKKITEKKKSDNKKQDKKDEKSKEDEAAKTRSKSKDDTVKGKLSSETRETRTPSRESEKKILNKQRRLTDEELKKRGRKRKEYDAEKLRADDQPVESAPCYKGPVELGDRLKVYYGPTHESKVTYEAKVIDIEKDAAEPVYLVHYTGWNTRYDEWIKASRIAQNFTQAQGRVKRIKATPRPQTPSTNLSNNVNKNAKVSGSTASNTSQSRRRAQSVAPVTSTSSTASSKDLKKDEKEKDVVQPVRSTTPLSVASSSSRTKSPATPANSRQTRTTRNADLTGVELRRRTRRTSGHTDISVASESEDSETYESDTTEPEQTKTRLRGIEERKRKDGRSRAEERNKSEEMSDCDDEKDVLEEPRRGRRLRRVLGKSQGGKSEPDSDEEQPKGRDFDLNQIRSELKGFDKAVKLELVRSEPDLEGEFKPDEKETTDLVSPKLEKSLDSPKSEILPEAKPVESTEDIYEFKEPEPFEFEVRNKKDMSGEKDKVKKRVFEEEPKSPKKKQKSNTPSVIKDGKMDTDCDRKKARKLFGKRSDDIVELSSNKPTASGCDDAFDKLCEAPSLNRLKPAQVNQGPGKVTNSLELLFSDLPGDDEATRDDSEDRLIISETEVSEAEQENLFTYQQEIFPANEIIDTIELTNDTKRQESNSQASESLPEKTSVMTTMTITTTATTTMIMTTTTDTVATIITTTIATVSPSLPITATATSKTGSTIDQKQTTKPLPVLKHSSETRTLDSKLLDITPITTSVVTTPAPISTRLPATSTIEEKLSAAMAFRTKLKEVKKVEEPAETARKSVRECFKKSDVISIQKNKEDQTTKPEVQEKREKEEDVREEEARIDVIQTVGKQKEDELQHLRFKNEVDRKKVVETKGTSDHRKVLESRNDEWKPRCREECKLDEVHKVQEQQEIDTEKRKKFEIVDSSDSSDSEQRLVIDNDDCQEIKESTSNFDIKIKTEINRFPDVQERYPKVPAQKPTQNPMVTQQSSLTEFKLDTSNCPPVKTDEEGETITSLLCEEEIPGSPAPAIENSEQGESGSSNSPPKSEAIESNIALMEIPFASAPTSGQSTTNNTVSTLSMALPKAGEPSVPVSLPMQQSVASGNRQQPQHQHQHQHQHQQHVPVLMAAQRRESNEAAPVMDNTPPTTPDSSISNISGSPREERTGGSSPGSEDNIKINRDSSEADNDSGSKGPGYSEDDTLNHEGNTGDRVLKPPAKRSVEDAQSPKKRKRNRKHSECGSSTGKKPVKQTNRHGRHGAGSDSDDTSEGSNLCGTNSTSTSHMNITSVTDLNNYSSSRSPRPMKYNFYVELDPELDGSQRIAVLQQKLTELRKTYNAVKVELAGIERRRKKLRRREREAMKAAKAEMQQACS